MSLKNFQNEVDAWISGYKIGYFQPLEILARLTEETGEVARELNHLFGPKKKKSTEEIGDLEGELGDMIFTIICLANSQKIDLDRAFARAMDKCHGRDAGRWEKK